MTVNRFCSSGLQTMALAAQRILAGEGDIFVAGGVESISLRAERDEQAHGQDEWLTQHKPEIYWPMLQTAEYVAKSYNISREAQDHYGARSQQRAAKARAEGKFKDEIVPITTKMKVVDKNTGAETLKEVTAEHDEGIRADTTYEGVSKIKPAIEGGVIAAGNASQFSDGASAAGRDERQGGGEERPQAAGRLPRLRGRRLRARRDGHRPGVRGAQAAASAPA